jgi:DNA-binding transcriptional regulator YiaG
MPNVATVLREEIRRLAKKEVKAQMAKLQKASIQYRRDITELKRMLKQQEEELSLFRKQVRQRSEPASAEEELEKVRFSVRSVKAQRRRLGLSAADYGKLVGVSGLTVYNWEHKKTCPREAQLAALVTARQIGKRAALQKLAEMETEKNVRRHRGNRRVR